MNKKIKSYLKGISDKSAPSAIEYNKNGHFPDEKEASFINYSVRNIKKDRTARNKVFASIAACAIFVFVILFNPVIPDIVRNFERVTPPGISNAPGSISGDPNSPGLPAVNNEEKLIELLSYRQEYKEKTAVEYFFQRKTMDSVGFAEEANYETGDTNYEAGTEHSKTNEQVEGVGEADIVKTDGKYAYYISGSTLFIADISNPSNMKILTKKNLYDDAKNKDSSYINAEMYLDGDLLTVITSSQGYSYDKDKISAITEIFVYDINNRENIVLTRNFSFDGYYNTSRKIGNFVYVIGNKDTNYLQKYDYAYEGEYRSNSDGGNSIESIIPKYKNGTDSQWENVPMSLIYYNEDIKEYENFQYLLALDITDPSSEPVLQTFMGNNGTVYSSKENLYIAAVNYNYHTETLMDDILNQYAYITYETVISKFNLKDGKINYDCSGTVEGNILNQFSMDEYNGNFRIAATVNERDGDESVSNLYILDKEMKIISTVGDMGRGERIYAVRFMGGKAFIVTFREVDPLYVVDVEDPANPEVMGELKIPGYSAYLHPYDETHIIGFGREDEKLKISMFDVSDYYNPKEMFKTYISSTMGYTDSTLLYDHKALLFSKEKDIFAFPVTAYGNTQKSYYLDYSIDLADGFIRKGEISHESGLVYTEYYNGITRGIYSGDVLFTFSGIKIMANSLDGMEFIGEINIS